MIDLYRVAPMRDLSNVKYSYAYHTRSYINNNSIHICIQKSRKTNNFSSFTKTMANRNIEDLHPSFRLRFMTALEEYNNKYPNKQIFVTETTRTKERQAQLVKQGYSKTMKSNHLTGMAVDIAFHWSSLYPWSKDTRLNLCHIMNKYGIVNAYYDLHWWFDKPHFQAVELQAPVTKKWISNAGYNYARWRLARMRASVTRHTNLLMRHSHSQIRMDIKEKWMRNKDVAEELIRSVST